MGKATMVIQRPRGGTRGRFAAFTVMLDGQSAGSVRYGGQLRLDVEPGQYQVVLISTLDPLYRSNPVRSTSKRAPLRAQAPALPTAVDSTSGYDWMRLGPGNGGTPDARVTVLDRPVRSKWLPPPATHASCALPPSYSTLTFAVGSVRCSWPG